MADFEDLDFGDETRRNGDYVGLPHDQASGGANDVKEGQPVAIDPNGNIKKAEDGDTIVGVLYTYQYYGEDNSIRQDREATVKTQGTVKAEVTQDASAGDSLAAPNTGGTATGTAESAGMFGIEDADDSYPFVALTDPADPDGDGRYYSEVLLH